MHPAGDRFNIYICDRFIVPALTSAQQRDIGAGRLLLDQMTRNLIREHLSYRFVVHQDGARRGTCRAGREPARRPALPEPALTACRPGAGKQVPGRASATRLAPHTPG